ncbi:MAG: hypothetical protein KatS3mg051_0480 [Anaerolineae bacterium]|nr:MAG: hypothetical protein KatS3mg051_0480 [Anaerolineae bacterium]
MQGLTDFVPELSKIHCDVAILPVAAGPGTLNLERTVELVRSLGARWVIPSHWGTFGGTLIEVQALERALRGTGHCAGSRAGPLRENEFLGYMQRLSATYLTRECLPHPQPRFARLAPSTRGEGAARRVSAERG